VSAGGFGAGGLTAPHDRSSRPQGRGFGSERRSTRARCGKTTRGEVLGDATPGDGVRKQIGGGDEVEQLFLGRPERSTLTQRRARGPLEVVARASCDSPRVRELIARIIQGRRDGQQWETPHGNLLASEAFGTGSESP
jgi:hypothetical protein